MAHHDREVWFRRIWLWSSTAVHWKGVVVILVVLLAGGLGFWVSEATQQPWIGPVGLVTSVAWGFVMAERHMDRPL